MNKFSTIKRLKLEKKFSDCIPDFISIASAEIDDSIIDFLKDSICIMRSCLLDEGGQNLLLAGISLSIKNIRSIDDFTKAYLKLSAQLKIDEVILQKEVYFENHLTVLMEEDFIYANITTIGKSGFFVLGPLVQMGNIPHQEKVVNFLADLKKRLGKGQWLLELGVTLDSVHLFQVVLIPKELLFSIFSDDLLCKIIKSKSNWHVNPTFWQLLKREWKAYQFRHKKDFTSSVSEAFTNWYYLFHYFYLYCRSKRLLGVDQDFVAFLTLAYNPSKNFQSEIIKKHLEIAGFIRQNEKENLVPASFSNISNQVYYLGKGVHQGIIGEKAILLTDLNPDCIYQLSLDKIIITPSSLILSHGILAAVERNINVLANVDLTLFASLRPSDHFFIDFQKSKMVLKS